MSKEEINLLKMQLYLTYYKNNITDRYVRVIENIVLDNDVLNNLYEKLYITTLDNYNELKEELKLAKENNLQLQQIIDKTIECCEKQKKKMYKSRNKIAMFILLDLLKILKGEDK